VSRVDYIVLNHKILKQELDWLLGVRLYPSHASRSKDHDGRFFFLEKMLDRLLVHQIEPGPITRYQIGKSVLL